jgi:tetratricopeptide (TPR) repeat protein
MNRMTAHLAMATALRGSRTPGIDARLAEATLLALTDRQTRALAILDGLSTGKTGDPDRAVSAWTRALRMRITDDWRQLADPAHATRLEQREYFRARRATTIRVSKGTAELERLGIAPDAEWVRIILSNSVGVEDASLITEAFDLERNEYEDVFMRMHGRAIGEKPAKALNAPASRCISDGAVHVLPWGAWAEFAQRHISMVIGRYDSFLRHSIGNRDQADMQQRVLERDLGDLWVFPMSTISWTKGPNGREADLRYINEAVDAVLSAPHRVPAVDWAFLETGTKYEALRRGIPPPGAWFVPAAPRAAYDASARVKAGLLRTPADMAAIMDGAPYDVRLIDQYLTLKYGQKAPFEEIERLAGARMSYDVRPGAWALANLPEDDSRRVAILEASCRIAPGSCTDLGKDLAKRGRDDEAARAYEQAFADPALDAVAVSNQSRWLVEYYASHNRVGPALQLADRAASTGASEGLAVAGLLYERLGRTEEALSMYTRNSLSYDDPSDLLGFYYRDVEVRKKREYEAAWHDARMRVFPSGMFSTPMTDAKPSAGVHVAKVSESARRIGLRAGDIIVAVDGWHVMNLPQYYAVRAFAESGPLTLTVWRGKVADVRIANRLLRPVFDIENYPVQGWIEH